MTIQPYLQQRGQLQESVQPIEVVDDAPMATRLFSTFTRHSSSRARYWRGIEVVRAKLRHVERDHVEPLEIERAVADIAFGVDPPSGWRRSEFPLRVRFSFRNSIYSQQAVSEMPG